MNRPGTALTRTSALLDLIDVYARDGGVETLTGDHWSEAADLAALRHLVECLDRICRNYITIAAVAETYVARACEDLQLIERDT